jgi:hypothetical protein
VYEPIDYLALYGKDPLNDFQLGGTHYVATGDSGQSMTGSALAAMVLGDEILGRANPYAEVEGPWCIVLSRILGMFLPFEPAPEPPDPGSVEWSSLMCEPRKGAF